MPKNLGPGVSAYLDPTDRSFETVVFQASKPVVDAELNLQTDLIEEISRVSEEGTPSGWVTKDFLKSLHVESLFTPSLSPDTLQLVSPLIARVNGFPIYVADTGATGTNTLTLPTPDPAPTKTTNLVILEVWRRLLSASPDTSGKSPLGNLWRFGNVKFSPDASNPSDDILNVAVGSETAKRVQIQYRLRVIESVDLVQYPTGITDPSVVANSVPDIPSNPDGLVTAFGYVDQSSAGKTGLWRAGDGNPANTLGTVDGYMYAIPLCAVFRRNSSAWDRNSNQNGGVASPGPSDRPDGLFVDIISERDVADLRKTLLPVVGSSPYEVGERAFHLLLDNQIRSEFGSTQFGPTPTGGMDGHTVVWCDQIGVPGAGDGIDTGNAVPAGALVRTFDGVARRFSDRVIEEIVTIRLDPTDQVPPAATWGSGNTVLISPTALKISPSSTPTNFASYAPANVSFQGVENLRFAGDGSTPGSVSGIAPTTITGNLGAIPVGNVSIVLGDLSSVPGLTDEPFLVDLRVMYPPGEGLQMTPTGDFGASSLEINNPASLPSDDSGTHHISFDYAHREVDLTYETVTLSANLRSKVTDAGVDRIRLPERAISLGTVTRNGAPLVGSATLSSDGRSVLLDTDFLTFPDTLEVDYVARRAFPQSGVQVSIFYETRVNQAIKEADLPTNLIFMPRWIAPKITLLSAGSATPDGEAYPFPYAYVQTGGLYNTSLSPSVQDSDLDSTLDLEIQGFSVSSGMFSVPAWVPFTPTEPVELVRVGGDDDAEGRTFYKAVAPNTYLPNAFAPSVSVMKKRKHMFPVCGELLTDYGELKAGSWILVVFYRWAEADIQTSVVFQTDQTVNRSTAAIYRIPGNPVVARLTHHAFL